MEEMASRNASSRTQEFMSGQNLILPPDMKGDEARILNLENAAAELIDQRVIPAPQRIALEMEGMALHRQDAKKHFQSDLKVTGLAGIRAGLPLAKSEWDGPPTEPIYYPAPPDKSKQAAAEAAAAASQAKK